MIKRFRFFCDSDNDDYVDEDNDDADDDDDEDIGDAYDDEELSFLTITYITMLMMTKTMIMLMKM